jgi:hypothetical protein
VVQPEEVPQFLLRKVDIAFVEVCLPSFPRDFLLALGQPALQHGYSSKRRRGLNCSFRKSASLIACRIF